MSLQRSFLCCIVTLSFVIANAQDDGGYKMPPKDIADMLLAKRSPSVSIDETATWMLLMETSSYPSVEELARPELKVAGIRINPANYAPSRQNFVDRLVLRQVASGKDFSIKGLPSPLAASNITWSPSGKKIAFIQTTPSRADLYIIDVASQKAMKVNKAALNTLSIGYRWYDDNTVLYITVLKPASTAPPKPPKDL
jgi:dipeptidyl aminopeptidase/acylaminoacyl peptidase